MSTFKQMTQSGVMKRADATKIRLEDIHEEPGFNLRDLDEVDAEDGRTEREHINDLAEYIAGGGIYPALEVRPRPDGGVWVVEGHRRRMALLKLDEEGRLPRTPNKEDPAILEAWVPIVQFVGNDADRVARIFTSQNNRKLSILASARGVKRLAAFGLSNAEIAAKIGKTPQRVAQLLDLSNANTDVQQMVAAGGVSATEATKVVREHGEKAGDVLREAAERAKADGKKKVTAKALKQDKPKPMPAHIANELAESAWALASNMPLETHKELAYGVSNGVHAIANVMVQVPAGFLLELVNAAQSAMDFKGGQIARILMAQEAAKQTTIEG